MNRPLQLTEHVLLASVRRRAAEMYVLRSSRNNEPAARRGGKNVHLGRYQTAEEAALHFARTPEGRAAAAAAPKPPLSAEEAVQAAEEGLTRAHAFFVQVQHRNVQTSNFRSRRSLSVSSD